MTPNVANPMSSDCGCGDRWPEAADASLGGAQSRCCKSATVLMDLGLGLLRLSAVSAAEFARQASALVSSALPGWEGFGLRPMCEIPETQCPPETLGTICWKGCPGATLTQSIRITNTAAGATTFRLSAAPLAGPGGVAIPLHLNPAQLPLAGGATGVVEAKVTIPASCAAGDCQTRILVAGAYEQHIDVRLCICSQQHCTLEVAQGDIPTRIRAHRWYHHFQCVEPCFPPARGRAPESPDVRPAVEPIAESDDL